MSNIVGTKCPPLGEQLAVLYGDFASLLQRSQPHLLCIRAEVHQGRHGGGAVGIRANGGGVLGGVVRPCRAAFSHLGHLTQMHCARGLVVAGVNVEGAAAAARRGDSCAARQHDGLPSGG